MRTLKKIFTAILIIATFSLYQLGAMKRKRPSTINNLNKHDIIKKQNIEKVSIEDLAVVLQGPAFDERPIEDLVVVQRGSAFEELPSEIIALHILANVFDLSHPQKLWRSIGKFRSLCLVDTKAFVNALQICLARKKENLCSIVNNHDETALHYAPFSEGIDTDRILILVAGDMRYKFLTMPGMAGRPALHNAVSLGNKKHVIFLLEIVGEDAFKFITMSRKNTSYRHSGYTAFHCAAQCKSEGMLAIFITWAKANDKLWDLMFMPSADDKKTGMHYAAEMGCVENVKNLIQAAGERASELVCMKTSGGKTALDLAELRRYGKSEVYTDIISILKDYA